MSRGGSRNKRSDAFGPPGLTPVGGKIEVTGKVREGLSILDSIRNNLKEKPKEEDKRKSRIQTQEIPLPDF